MVSDRVGGDHSDRTGDVEQLLLTVHGAHLDTGTEIGDLPCAGAGQHESGRRDAGQGVGVDVLAIDPSAGDAGAASWRAPGASPPPRVRPPDRSGCAVCAGNVARRTADPRGRVRRSPVRRAASAASSAPLDRPTRPRCVDSGVTHRATASATVASQRSTASGRPGWPTGVALARVVEAQRGEAALLELLPEAAHPR